MRSILKLDCSKFRPTSVHSKFRLFKNLVPENPLIRSSLRCSTSWTPCAKSEKPRARLGKRLEGSPVPVLYHSPEAGPEVHGRAGTPYTYKQLSRSESTRAPRSREIPHSTTQQFSLTPPHRRRESPENLHIE